MFWFYDILPKIIHEIIHEENTKEIRIISVILYDRILLKISPWFLRLYDSSYTVIVMSLNMYWVYCKKNITIYFDNLWRMYKVLNDHTRPGLRNSFVRRSVSQNRYNLRNTTTDLTLLKPKREFLRRTFKYSGAMLWNQLSCNEAKTANSLYMFKNYIRP